MNKKIKPEEALDFGMKFTINESLDKLPTGPRVMEMHRKLMTMFRNVKSWPPEYDRFFKKK